MKEIHRLMTVLLNRQRKEPKALWWYIDDSTYDCPVCCYYCDRVVNRKSRSASDDPLERLQYLTDSLMSLDPHAEMHLKEANLLPFV